MTATSALSSAFLAAGVRRGGVLLVHSSLSSLGHVPGGADAVIDALLECLGPEGTLVLPTLSYLFCTVAHPFFDVRSTPTNLGALPSTFLRRAGVVRSLHPTHSCAALGAKASAVVANHGLDTTPVGPHSPFTRVRDLGGQIAFLGCGMRCNTSIHGVEEALPDRPPYLLLPDAIEYTLTDSAGVTTRVSHLRHNFSGTVQRYERLADIVPHPHYTHGAVLAAELHVFDARVMWAVATEALLRDPACLTATGSEEHELVAGSGDGVWRYKIKASSECARPPTAIPS